MKGEKMNLKRTRFTTTAVIVILAMMLSCLPFDSVYAAIEEVDAPEQTYSFSSGSGASGEDCTGTIEGSTLKIKYKTLISSVQFRVALYGVNPKTKLVDLGIYIPAGYSGISSTGKSTYGFEYSLDFAINSVPDGEYFLYISQLKNYADVYETTPTNGSLYKNLPIIVKDGIPTIPRYNDIISENDRIQKNNGWKPEDYLDTSLEDVRFLFVDPGTKVREEMTEAKAAYFRQLSNRITSGAYRDYDKLLKIYEYVAGNFYYDTVAFSSHSYQYANPYRNLYNHENKIASPNSDSQGRVATTCQGFAGMYLALARAQGIPTRLIYGHRAASPQYNWNTEPNLTARDHWWAESYVDGRWIAVDPTTGTNNRWNKNTNTWQYYGVTNYTYFDPSKEQMAVSHLYFDVYRNLFAGSEIKSSAEMSRLKTFFAIKSSGTANGRLLNPNYKASDTRTWGDGVINNFYGDGKGQTSRIKWIGFGLSGSADFSGFTKLKYFYLNDNKLTSVNLNNDSSLLKVDVRNNDLTTISLTNCKKLTSVLTEGNRLQQVKIYANKRNTTITSGENGYIYVTYTKANRYKLRTFFVPDLGYKVKGFYNKKGKKLTSTKSYSMNPVTSAYNVVFEPDPNSYRYTLKLWQNTGAYADYNTAAQKRLKDLGYFAGEADGYFDREMETAVLAFQTDFNLEPTGQIDEATWSLLFTPDPKPIVDEEPEPEPLPEPEPSTGGTGDTESTPQSTAPRDAAVIISDDQKAPAGTPQQDQADAEE